MLNFYRNIISNTVFSNVILLLVLLLGYIATTTMIRESQPDTTIPMFKISVPYPGADPEEVAEGVTRKIEGVVDGIQGVEQYTSTSYEGIGEVIVEVSTTADLADMRDKLRNAVDSIVNFPEEAEPPQVRRVENIEDVVKVAIWGGLPERQLKELAETMRKEIQALPDISTVLTRNTRPYEIAVNVSKEQLQKYNLTLAQVSRTIRQSSLNRSGGTLELEGEEMRIRTVGKRYTGSELKSIPVLATPSGEQVLLGQIAEIRDGFSEEDIYASFNGNPAVLLTILKAPGEDSITIGDAVTDYLVEKRPSLPKNIHLTEVFDNSVFIRSQINIITKNGLLGLVLVLVILWLFLEARLAFWVAMGIPISLAGAVFILWLMGSSLNQITLVGMIVVMGIIVDDAIVAGEAIYVHRQKGKDPLTAAVDGIREIGLPILASVSTTIIAFAPMMFISGQFGQIAKNMPHVVIAALTVSLAECLFLLPAHLLHRRRKDRGLPKRSLNPLQLRRWTAQGLERFVEHVYGPFIRIAVRFRYVTISGGITIILITAGLIGGGVIKVVMWPGAEGDNIDANIEFPPGTQHEVVREAVIRYEEAIQRVSNHVQTASGKPLLKNVYATTPSGNDATGSISVEFIPYRERGITTDEISALWYKEVGDIPGVLAQNFTGATIGANFGGDIEFWLKGSDLTALRSATAELKAKLRQYDGVYQITDNFRPGKSELHISLKPAAHSLGLTTDEISRQIQSSYYGDEVLHLQRGREEVDVRLRLPRAERENIRSLETMHIQTANGKEVPIRAVAHITYKEGVSQISSINGLPGVRVSASVNKNVANPTEINTDLIEHYMETIPQKFSGITWALSGSEQENQKVVKQLSRNNIISLFGIFIILATVFRSYIQPIIIMIIIPYGLVGAVWGHILLDIPLSFLSLGGIVALAGVLVNDSIVLIERINTNLAAGMNIEDAVCLGGQRRFRAIFLTSLSTCVGMAPLIAESDLSAQVVTPMAVSLAGGVSVGTMLTLVLVPAFLVIMNDCRRLNHRLLKGAWPTPEEVEPAVKRNQPHGTELTATSVSEISA